MTFFYIFTVVFFLFFIFFPGCLKAKNLCVRVSKLNIHHTSRTQRGGLLYSLYRLNVSDQNDRNHVSWLPFFLSLRPSVHFFYIYTSLLAFGFVSYTLPFPPYTYILYLYIVIHLFRLLYLDRAIRTSPLLHCLLPCIPMMSSTKRHHISVVTLPFSLLYTHIKPERKRKRKKNKNK